MTMNGAPSSVTPWSKTWTTWGLFTCAAAAASRPKRARAELDARSSPSMNFTTTWVLSAR